MELRKDPITRSWVVTGDDAPEWNPSREPFCRFCGDAPMEPAVLSSMPAVDGGPWSSRAVAHPAPVYHAEGEPDRRGDGIYDRMRSIGAHEILVEGPGHDRQLWQRSDAEIVQFLLLAAHRIQDLKGDPRYRYVCVFKNFGEQAGQEFAHPHSSLVASSFVPRRVLYELRSGREYFKTKERCVFCDIIAQEEKQRSRIIEERGDFLALSPYAPRVPYETWLISRIHHASFEQAALTRMPQLRDLAALLRRTLNRILSVADAFHLVVHTSPNPRSSETLGYWRTIDEDYHWHIEITPILGNKVKSYTFKEVYYSPISPETAAQRLREGPTGE